MTTTQLHQYTVLFNFVPETYKWKHINSYMNKRPSRKSQHRKAQNKFLNTKGQKYSYTLASHQYVGLTQTFVTKLSAHGFIRWLCILALRFPFTGTKRSKSVESWQCISEGFRGAVSCFWIAKNLMESLLRQVETVVTVNWNKLSHNDHGFGNLVWWSDVHTCICTLPAGMFLEVGRKPEYFFSSLHVSRVTLVLY